MLQLASQRPQPIDRHHCTVEWRLVCQQGQIQGVRLVRTNPLRDKEIFWSNCCREGAEFGEFLGFFLARHEPPVRGGCDEYKKVIRFFRQENEPPSGSILNPALVSFCGQPHYCDWPYYPPPHHHTQVSVKLFTHRSWFMCCRSALTETGHWQLSCLWTQTTGDHGPHSRHLPVNVSLKEDCNYSTTLIRCIHVGLTVHITVHTCTTEQFW